MAASIQQKAWRFLRYGNRRARLWRLANLVELRHRRLRLSTYPPILCLDPAPFCNLHCPCCPTGGEINHLTMQPLTPETFQRIVSHLRVDRLAHVNLYRIGEPLLNPHLDEFARFFAARGIYTAVSVNFSARDYDEAYFRRLIASGLSEITVSVDGTTQETYEMYRRGGNLSRVLKSMRLLADTKRRMHARTPRVIFKMLLNKFNQHQVDDARRMAAELDADFYQPHFFWAPGDEWTADKFKEMYAGRPQTYVVTDDRHRDVDTECRQLWDTLHVHSNGDVMPCCMAFEPQFAVGNLVEQSIDQIWNNEKMQALRRYVVDTDAPPPGFANPCRNCARRFCTYWT